jgi:hypothetical protein
LGRLSLTPATGAVFNSDQLNALVTIATGVIG